MTELDPRPRVTVQPTVALVAVPDELRRRIHPIALSGCWEWVGARNRKRGDYGQTHGDWAHRAVWKATVGPIADGVFLDHLCRFHPCVNPAHLDPVTPAENTRRAVEAREGLCRAGLHDMTDPANVYVRPDGQRWCRECKRASQRAKYATDTEFRERRLAWQRSPEVRARNAARNRERYATDEAFRERNRQQRAKQKARRQADPELRAQVNARARETHKRRMAEDPEYRERIRARNKARRARRRADPEAVERDRERNKRYMREWWARNRLDPGVTAKKNADARKYRAAKRTITGQMDLFGEAS